MGEFLHSVHTARAALVIGMLLLEPTEKSPTTKIASRGQKVQVKITQQYRMSIQSTLYTALGL